MERGFADFAFDLQEEISAVALPGTARRGQKDYLTRSDAFRLLKTTMQ
jgi:hypothetical protein